MKRIGLFLLMIFFCESVHAETINLDWYVDGDSFTQTTCEIGNTVTPPTAPEKYGYTFHEWLPYIPLEYIQSTGTQWIDMGFAYDNVIGYLPFKMELNFAIMSTPESYRPIMGANTTGGDNILTIWQHNDNNKPGFYILHRSGCCSNLINSPSTISTPINLILEINPQNMLFNVHTDYNDTHIVEQKLPAGNPLSSKNIYFFKDNAPISRNNAHIRVYHLVFYSNGIKFRDFVPALDGNNTPCLYDKVSKQFFYNQGTGDFIAGPEI